ncbi:MFS transporter [Frankia sp. AgKG'84/4]|uniref:MFS transporter n=1 Tax=Frankia sp. AgKG'84/4 TaxID=573490 RepID=UPI00200C3FCC|nr:MFS transporter [Frankia sp. AgKG'84/4]MCL9793439.1 MFS transporter [Frankia sp. AgKG'84/4]
MRKGQIGFLTTSHTINDLYQGAVPAMLPFLMSQRGYSYSALAGISLAATGLSSVVQPLFGVLADRRARPWLAPAGTVLAAVGVAAAAMVDSYPATWLCIALSGIGIAAFHPPATSLARNAGGNSQRAMSVFSIGGTLGSSLAPVMVTVVARTAGLSSGWLLALPAVLIVGVWGTRLSRERRRRSAGPAEPLAQRAGESRGAHGSTGTDDWSAFSRLIGVTVCWSIPYVTMTSLLSLHAQHSLHGSSTVGAIMLGSFTLAGAVGTLLGGWLGDWRGRLVTIRVGYLLGVPALTGVVLAPNLAVLAVSVAVAGMALFLPFAVQVTLAQDYLPRRPGTASGLTLGLAISVGGLSAPLFGWCADAYGLRCTLGAVTAVYLGAVAIALRLPERVREPVGDLAVVDSAADPGGDSAALRVASVGRPADLISVAVVPPRPDDVA